MTKLPLVSFGMIVLNGEPFLTYNLRALYPFAHQIIVVEGTVPAAAAVATLDGHSSDGTLETLQHFKDHNDPDDKLIIVTAEDEGHPNGFWPGEKDEQSRAYARRATGDYLWQVDVDEFYLPEDMEKILNMLHQQPGTTAVSFKQIQFWGGFDYYVDGWYLRRGGEQFHRLFAWGPRYTYQTHRPPTVLTADGRDVRAIQWIGGHDLAEKGVYLYHYSLVFPKQVTDKCEYYGHADWARRADAQQWASEVFLELKRPFRVHNVYHDPSWLERFSGVHPPQINAFRGDLENGRLQVEVRKVEDIERLLSSKGYQVGRAVVRGLEPVDRRLRKIRVYGRARGWLGSTARRLGIGWGFP